MERGCQRGDAWAVVYDRTIHRSYLPIAAECSRLGERASALREALKLYNSQKYKGRTKMKVEQLLQIVKLMEGKEQSLSGNKSRY